MHALILWAGFVGAWLLVFGPLYQAALELNEEDVQVDRLREKMLRLPPMSPPSRWWWLLPPVALVLRRRHRERWRHTLMESLTLDEFTALMAFGNKARGWVFVGLGGLLIAAKETYELVEGNEWPLWVFWALVVAVALLALNNTAYSMRHDEQALADHQARLSERDSDSRISPTA